MLDLEPGNTTVRAAESEKMHETKQPIGFLSLAGLAIALAGCGIPIQPRTEPPETARASSPSVQESTPERRPIVIDTDMDIDDMMVLIVLLNSPAVEIKAITVLSDGWSSQYSGVEQAMRLTQKYGAPDIPVAYMSDFLGQTQLNTRERQNLPSVSRMTGINTYLTEWVPTPPNLRPPAWQTADLLMSEILGEAARKGETVDIIALGPWTNLAQALQRNHQDFLDGLGNIYVSGFGFPTKPETDSSRPFTMSDVNATTPVEYLTYTAKVPGSAWNVFNDPISTSQVLTALQSQKSTREVIVMSKRAQDMLHVYPGDAKFIPAACPREQADYLSAFYENFAASSNEPYSEVKYWDPSTAIVMLDVLLGKPRSICTRWEEIRIQVNLLPGPQYSWTVDSANGLKASVCRAADITAFKERYFSTGCGRSEHQAGTAPAHTRPRGH